MHRNFVFEDCNELLDYGKKAEPGNNDLDLHWIKPQWLDEPFQVLCYLAWGGATVLQRNRVSDDSCPVTFNKNWEAYKNGFDMFNATWCGLWMGNDNIHHVLRQATYTAGFGIMVINPRDNPTVTATHKWHQCYYHGFMVQNETDNYIMTYTSFSTHAEQQALDSMGGGAIPANEAANGMKFSTMDRDNDLSGSDCATLDQSGWWFNDCSGSNVNRSPPQWRNDLASYGERYSHINLARSGPFL